jgi:hypothetical protein
MGIKNIKQTYLPAVITAMTKTNQYKRSTNQNGIAVIYTICEFVYVQTKYTAVIKHNNSDAIFAIRTNCGALSKLLIDAYDVTIDKFDTYASITGFTKSLGELILIINDGLKYDGSFLQPEPAVFLIEFDNCKWLENRMRVAWSNKSHETEYLNETSLYVDDILVDTYTASNADYVNFECLLKKLLSTNNDIVKFNNWPLVKEAKHISRIELPQSDDIFEKAAKVYNNLLKYTSLTKQIAYRVERYAEFFDTYYDNSSAAETYAMYIKKCIKPQQRLIAELIKNVPMSQHTISTLSTFDNELESLHNAMNIQILHIKSINAGKCEHSLTKEVEDEAAFNYHTNTSYHRCYCRICGRQLSNLR